MRKVMVAVAAIALAGGVHADMFLDPVVGYGIAGNGSAGGIVNAIDGTTIVLQIINGGGDGLDYINGNQVPYNGGFQVAGNDILVGLISQVVTGSGADFSDYGATLAGTIGGHGTPWSSDVWVRVSGIEDGDWVWEGSIVANNADYSDPKTLPQTIAVDNSVLVSADGSVTVSVIPEPATIGLMGIAGLGMFLARRKARR